MKLIKNIIHKLKRWWLARPVLFIDCDYYLLAYQWRDGIIECIQEGNLGPWEYVKVPKNTMVYYDRGRYLVKTSRKVGLIK